MKNSENQDISKSIKQLMTYKGRIAGIYLENLTRIFNQLNPEFNFTGRKNKSNSRNYDASDEINALFNTVMLFWNQRFENLSIQLVWIILLDSRMNV